MIRHLTATFDFHQLELAEALSEEALKFQHFRKSVKRKIVAGEGQLEKRAAKIRKLESNPCFLSKQDIAETENQFRERESAAEMVQTEIDSVKLDPKFKTEENLAAIRNLSCCQCGSSFPAKDILECERRRWHHKWCPACFDDPIKHTRARCAGSKNCVKDKKCCCFCDYQGGMSAYLS